MIPAFYLVNKVDMARVLSLEPNSLILKDSKKSLFKVIISTLLEYPKLDSTMVVCVTFVTQLADYKYNKK